MNLGHTGGTTSLSWNTFLVLMLGDEQEEATRALEVWLALLRLLPYDLTSANATEYGWNINIHFIDSHVWVLTLVKQSNYLSKTSRKQQVKPLVCSLLFKLMLFCTSHMFSKKTPPPDFQGISRE